MSDEAGGVNRRDIVYGRHSCDKRDRAGEMRRQMTPSEETLWHQLRANRLGGLQFRRQQIIDGLIVDFYCHAAGIVVEVDGPVHETRQEQDEDRDAILKARGLCVFRFSIQQVEHDLRGVLNVILAVALERKKCL